MIEQLIITFLNQDYSEKELVISDDSPNTSVEQIVQKYKNPSITYIKNKTNLGYGKNLLHSLQSAQGDYLIILGDDDVLLSQHTLSTYVSVFEKNPSVGYIYCNQIQFSNTLDAEYIINIFNQDTLFKKGEEAMRSLWTTSVFIPGIGIRNNEKLLDLFPKQQMLFPQVELVGHILNQFDGFGVEERLIAGRSHPEQLGFSAIKQENIKGDEQHGTIELFQIFERLSEKYSFTFNNEFLAQNLLQSYYYMIFKEKMLVGNKLITENYHNFCDTSPIAKQSKKMRFYFEMAKLTPSWLLKILRRFAIIAYKYKQQSLIQEYKKQLHEMLLIPKNYV